MLCVAHSGLEKLTFLHKILPAASVAAPPGSPLSQLDVWQVVGGAPPRGGALVTEEGGRREVKGCMSARRPAHLSPATAEEGQDAMMPYQPAPALFPQCPALVANLLPPSPALQSHSLCNRPCCCGNAPIPSVRLLISEAEWRNWLNEGYSAAR